MLLEFQALLSTNFRTISAALVAPAFVFAVWFPAAMEAAPLKAAHVTAVIKDVRLLAPKAAPRPAALNDDVCGGTAMQTGGDSRAELTFNNQAVARLSANAALTFKAGDSLDLTQGAVLIQVPNGVKVKLQAGGVAAGLSGVTAVLEYQQPAFKFLVIEGIGRLYRPRHLGDSVLVRAGQMIFGSANAALSDPVDFDIGRFVKTCPLLQEFPPLESETLIANESRKQEREKTKKILIDTNLVIFGGGTLVSLVDPGTNASAPTVPALAPSPAPASTPLATSR